MLELERVVLSGLKHGDDQRWVYALGKLEEEWFLGQTRKLFKLLHLIYERVGKAVTQEVFELAIAGYRDKAELAVLVDLWNDLTLEPTEAAFRAALFALEQNFLDRQFTRVISTALEINAGEVVTPKGILRGRDAARDYLLAELPALGGGVDDPLVDAVAEAGSLEEAYFAAKEGDSDLIPTGIESIDNIIHGLDRSDLMIVSGVLGEGKSTLAINIGYGIMRQGLNVMYLTTETVPDRIRRRLIVRHSCDKRFRARIPYTDLKFGRLQPKLEPVLHEVVQDLEQGRFRGDYGAFLIASISTFGQLRHYIVEGNRLTGGLDFVIVDYLALLAGSIERIDLAMTIIEAKRLAVEMNIPILSPWQVSLQAWRDARQRGFYERGSSGETSEVEKTADAVLTLLADEEVPGRMIMKFTKVRDGNPGPVFFLTADLDYAFIGDAAGNMNRGMVVGGIAL